MRSKRVWISRCAVAARLRVVAMMSVLSRFIVDMGFCVQYSISDSVLQSSLMRISWYTVMAETRRSTSSSMAAMLSSLMGSRVVVVLAKRWRGMGWV